jgi:hypothetical protein
MSDRIQVALRRDPSLLDSETPLRQGREPSDGVRRIERIRITTANDGNFT